MRVGDPRMLRPVLAPQLYEEIHAHRLLGLIPHEIELPRLSVPTALHPGKAAFFQLDAPDRALPELLLHLKVSP